MLFQRCGNSSIHLPLISLDITDTSGHPQADNRHAIFQEALKHGISHWDLSTDIPEMQQLTETHLRSFLRDSCDRNDIFLSSSISPMSYPMFRSCGKKGIRIEMDRLLSSLNLEYLDLFFLTDPHKDCSHEEAVSAIEREISSGRLLYVGLWDFNTSDSQKWMDLLAQAGISVLLHKSIYSPADRSVERTLDHLLEMTQTGMTAVKALNVPKYAEKVWSAMADQRNQTADQMTLSWLLRQSYVNSVTVPLSPPEKFQEYCRCVDNLVFETEELESIEAILKKA